VPAEENCISRVGVQRRPPWGKGARKVLLSSQISEETRSMRVESISSPYRQPRYFKLTRKLDVYGFPKEDGVRTRRGGGQIIAVV